MVPLIISVYCSQDHVHQRLLDGFQISPLCLLSIWLCIKLLIPKQLSLPTCFWVCSHRKQVAGVLALWILRTLVPYLMLYSFPTHITTSPVQDVHQFRDANCSRFDIPFSAPFYWPNLPVRAKLFTFFDLKPVLMIYLGFYSESSKRKFLFERENFFPLFFQSLTCHLQLFVVPLTCVHITKAAK